MLGGVKELFIYADLKVKKMAEFPELMNHFLLFIYFPLGLSSMPTVDEKVLKIAEQAGSQQRAHPRVPSQGGFLPCLQEKNNFVSNCKAYSRFNVIWF